MLLRFPRLSDPWGGYDMIGFGDILFPGLPNLPLCASKVVDLSQGAIDPTSRVADLAKITQIDNLRTQP